MWKVIDKDEANNQQNVDLRVQWLSWRKLTGVMYDHKMPLILNSKGYKVSLNPP